MQLKRTRSIVVVAALAAAGTLVLQGAAEAQEGYYDQYGNFIQFDPPPPGYRVRPDVYGEPPPVYYEPPPVYYEPPVYADPPVYYEPPPVYDERPSVYYERPPVYDEPPPAGWGRRVLVPPADIPDPRYAEPPPERRILEPRVPDDYFLEADPDAESLPPDRYDVPRGTVAEPVERRPIEPDVAEPGGWQAEPDLGTPPETRRVAVGDPGQALRGIPRYAAAKKAAIAILDPNERNTAVRKVNAWLVSLSVQPATAGTIRGLDRLLGLEVTPQTTALPGAGIEVTSPSAGESRDGSRVASLLADYAAIRGDVLRMGDSARRVEVAREAEGLLAKDGVELAPEEIAGIDAFLGLADVTAVVAQRPAGAGAGTRLQ